MSTNGDVLARFHRTLVEEIRSHRPEYLDGPFTVAEIYQNLVPYGTHRDRLGVDMNGDYEDALLRLLAGEGGYLLLESAPALRALREEVDSNNPNTGIYREYAAVDVRLDPDRLRFALPGRAPVAYDEPVSIDELAPVPASPDRDAEDAPAPVRGSGEGPGEVVESCRWCRAELPHRANLNFCPFCGTDVHVVPCPACGEELDPEWRFCISCGAEVRG